MSLTKIIVIRETENEITHRLNPTCRMKFLLFNELTFLEFGFVSTDFRLAKRRFTIELWEGVVTIIVKECGVDPALMNKTYFRKFAVP